MSIADLRREYSLTGLRKADLAADPLQQFRHWFDQALAAGTNEPNAMVLATADAAGKPSTRVVLLKGLDERGFVFFTNYESRKARELAVNRHAALNFFWVELERQVCVTGSVTQVPREEAEAYFKTRPRGSRLGAWASKQSETVPSREVLEARLQELEKKYPGEEIPLPPFWGGYVLAPGEIDFWQGRPNRLHDRFRYSKQADGRWLVERLSP
jgi:pyridoxamine 5'-phosphate oxidase